eukprot:14955891-Alexandrium_andersonii.AAC.1
MCIRDRQVLEAVLSLCCCPSRAARVCIWTHRLQSPGGPERSRESYRKAQRGTESSSELRRARGLVG